MVTFHHWKVTRRRRDQLTKRKAERGRCTKPAGGRTRQRNAKWNEEGAPSPPEAGPANETQSGTRKRQKENNNHPRKPQQPQNSSKKIKTAFVSKRQRRNPLRYHSYCPAMWWDPSTAGNGATRPRLNPLREHSAEPLRGDFLLLSLSAFHPTAALCAGPKRVLFLILAYQPVKITRRRLPKRLRVF